MLLRPVYRNGTYQIANHKMFGNDDNEDDDAEHSQYNLLEPEDGGGGGSTDDSTDDGSTDDSDSTDDSYTPPPDSGGIIEDDGGGGSSVTHESDVHIRNYSVTGSAPETISVTFDLVNEVTSGSGRSISGTIDVTLDGNKVDEIDYNIGAGNTRGYSVDLTGVNAGARTVCARL